MPGGVDAFVTRSSDGRTLAIEHTLIEPFQRDKEDFVSFEEFFLEIENDKSLTILGYHVQVFVPVGALDRRARGERIVIVRAVHDWLKSNRELLSSEGHSQYICPIMDASDITLNVKVVPLKDSGSAERKGILQIRRQQIENNLGEVIEKALERKLPKLAKVEADKRILLLERQHMNLFPTSMLEEIEKRRTLFPQLAKVHEIWIVEAIFYDDLRFERYENGNEVDSFNFSGDELLS
jgi:hypothetical protein